MQREQVLIVADGEYLEFYAPKHIDIAFVRVPQAETLRGGRIADVCLEEMIPLRYRSLYDRSLLRGNGIAKPLSPEVALYARAKRRALIAVDAIKDEKRGAVA